MTEELQKINDIIKNIANFIQQDSAVKPDFLEYLKTVGNSMNIQMACFNYIFERKINGKSITELYSDNAEKLTTDEKKIISALKSTLSSVFEVRKITKNGFSLYNIINEKLYDILSLVKMSSFRGIGCGQYVIARIFEYKKEFYLLEISGVLSSARRDDALRFAVAKIIENPELVYRDNPQKLKEIEKDVAKIYKDFIEFFGTNTVITTNKYIDELIGIFNDYTESDKKVKQDVNNLIAAPKEYKYFNVNEFQNNYNNFLENSLNGFSAHNEEYDVALIFDEELGMYAIPFYGTFNQIFEEKDYTSIANYDKCIEYFLNNDKFSANLIKSVEDKHKNFMKVVNAILKTDLTLDDLLKKYKSRYLENKIISSTTVLYRSIAFSNTLGIIEENENKPKFEIDHKIGRNEPCPCGSGKKYKHCCGASI